MAGLGEGAPEALRMSIISCARFRSVPDVPLVGDAMARGWSHSSTCVSKYEADNLCERSAKIRVSKPLQCFNKIGARFS